MNRKITRFLVVAAVLAFIGAVILFLREGSVSSTGGGVTRPSDDQQDVAAPSVSEQASEPGIKKGPQQPQKDGGKFADLAMLSSVPIEFYGRVIDQDGKGLSDVQVVGGTGSTTGFMRRETRRYTTTSDANGYFSFKGFSGDGLIIVLSKEGYHFESDRNRFHYAPLGGQQGRFAPEPKNPVVFQMWRALGAEPLISYYGQSVRISTDGTPARIDLEKGTKVDVGGDLLVSINWGRRSDPGSYAFDWSLKLEVPSGGLIESTGDVRFLAPAEGYRKTFEYHANAQQRQGSLKRTFYMMSRPERIFSRVEISIQNDPTTSDARATFRVQLNPKAGSRILEPPNSPRTR